MNTYGLKILLAHLNREAKHQRSYEKLKGLKDKGQATDPEYGTPDELAAKISQCDARMGMSQSSASAPNTRNVFRP